MKGSITKRGSSWSIMIDLPRDPVTGKRRQKRITAPTKRDVETQATKLLASIESGGFAEADAARLTVSEYLARWVGSIGQTVRPATHRRYADLIKQHIDPVIGSIRLAKLSPLDVQTFYKNRLDSGLSATSVELVHCVLHRALKQAVRWGLLTRNVTEAVDVPRRVTPEYVTWNERQAAAFLAVANQNELAALWRLALLTGMRRGEILALKWGDLDLVRCALSVRRTLSRGPEGSFDFGQTKTRHGRRQIALPRSVVEALHKHRVKQVECRLLRGTVYNDNDLVFADALGNPLHPNTLRLHFLRLIKEAGVPVIRFHDLRHSSATLMLANGEHPKIVSERLGHANISITLDRYSHVTQEMQRDAADRLDSLIAGNS